MREKDREREVWRKGKKGRKGIETGRVEGNGRSGERRERSGRRQGGSKG